MGSAKRTGETHKIHKKELLKHGVQESDNDESDDEDWGEHQEPGNCPIKEEDDSLDNGDLTYITAILESFSRPKSNSEKLSAPNCAIFTPEGAPTPATAKPMMPPKFNPKFNQTFNQNSTSKHPGAENFSCFSTIWEERPTELADYSDEEEDDSLDNEDTLIERDTWNKFDLEELGEISHEEDTWSKTELDKFELEAHSEVDYEEPVDRTTFTAFPTSQKRQHRHFQHGNHIFLQNLSSEAHLLDLGGRTLHSRCPYHRSLPSSRSQQSGACIQKSNQLQHQ
jgi:hypothetical protein